MKAIKKTITGKFEPVTIEITFESKSELALYLGFSNLSGDSKRALYEKWKENYPELPIIPQDDYMDDFSLFKTLRNILGID